MAPCRPMVHYANAGSPAGVISRRRWIAAITQRETLVRILEHLGLESVAPPPAPPRAPPQIELSWEGA